MEKKAPLPDSPDLLQRKATMSYNSKGYHVHHSPCKWCLWDCAVHSLCNATWQSCPQLYFTPVTRHPCHCLLYWYRHCNPFPWASTVSFCFFPAKEFDKKQAQEAKTIMLTPHSLDSLTHSQPISISMLHVSKEHHSSRDAGPNCLRTWKTNAHCALLLGGLFILFFSGIYDHGLSLLYVCSVLAL